MLTLLSPRLWKLLSDVLSALLTDFLVVQRNHTRLLPVEMIKVVSLRLVHLDLHLTFRTTSILDKRFFSRSQQKYSFLFLLHLQFPTEKLALPLSQFLLSQRKSRHQFYHLLVQTANLLLKCHLTSLVVVEIVV